MDLKEKALQKHYEWQGKIEVVSRAPLNTREDLSLAYTPGVAQASLAVAEDEDLSYTLTRRGNMVAVITDGTAVLGLGDIGPAAAMPVMEGKCALFKAFADVDAFPICINSKDVDTIVNTVKLIEKSFGGINLEDIGAPRCFEVERRLKEECDIPVFHDDQHGTAIIASAAIINAIKVTGREMGKLKIVVNGAGAAGISIAKLLLKMGFGEVTMCDIGGIIYEGADWLTGPQAEMAKVTNPAKQQGKLADALVGADLFIGVSRPGLVTREMVATMAKDPIIFAMANPTPEIMPDEAKAGGAAVVGTGRSDFPNQINNVLAFPGIFKGALAVRARGITEEMKVAAAKAIAAMVSESELCADFILPDPLNKKVADAVAKAVADEAVRTGTARVNLKK
ncbi:MULTISPECIES: NAD(P)-dependent malic enzyme [Anaerotruncus]|uniref:NAD(P)-dependent malic enzyme n=2 Tax=Oscillospiraceae TaxID=216572 RepID=UPI00082F7450|nr:MULTISPECIES: NADP-dependent malic enzyme [Anaerotruncus]RGX56006.1 NADP-dependent malic enzyme [Anaerotruncus sp. AF02-27]